jgi:hypothetical protein
MVSLSGWEYIYQRFNTIELRIRGIRYILTRIDKK